MLSQKDLPSNILNTFKTQDFDAIVVGGGILGTAMAVTLAKQNRNICLIERDWNEPDRIVGELLQPGGVNALKELGLEDTLLGMDGIDVQGYVVITDDDHVI